MERGGDRQREEEGVGVYGGVCIFWCCTCSPVIVQQAWACRVGRHTVGCRWLALCDMQQAARLPTWCCCCFRVFNMHTQGSNHARTQSGHAQLLCIRACAHTCTDACTYTLCPAVQQLTAEHHLSLLKECGVLCAPWLAYTPGVLCCAVLFRCGTSLPLLMPVTLRVVPASGHCWSRCRRCATTLQQSRCRSNESTRYTRSG